MSRLVTRAFALVLAAWPAAVHAAPPNVEACASAYEEAQRRQGKGALLDAREQASTCADAACPAGIVTMCSTLAADLDQTIPTIVVAPLDPEGHDVTGARLVVDGKEPGVAIDGRAVPLDPGAHRLRVVPGNAGLEPVELDVTLLAGQRNRRVEARLARTGGPSSRPASPGPAPTTTGDDGGSLTVPAIIALSVGGVGLAVGTITGVLALGEDATLADLCATETSCPEDEQDRIDRAGTFATVSTVGLVVGVLGVATGVVLLAVGSDADTASAASARGLTVRF